MDSNKKVLFIHPVGYLSIYPTLISSVQYLKEKGYDAHMISVEGEVINSVDLKVYCFKEIDFVNHSVLTFRTLLRRIRILLYHILYPFYVFIVIHKNNYDKIIIVDYYGLVYSFLGGIEIRKTLYIVLHMEHMSDILKQHRIKDFIFKVLEKFLLKYCKHILIQDAYRREAFIKENKLLNCKINYYLVPNTYRGSVNTERTDFYQKKFELINDTRLVILAGNICEKWNRADFLINCTTSQGSFIYYKLLLQSSLIIPEDNLFLKKLIRMADDNVLFSLIPNNINNLNNAISSAHIGCAIYTGESANQSLVGGASGKMFTYLKNGLPVIMIDSPGITEVIEQYKCGKVIKNLDEQDFNKAVYDILNDYEFYSLNANLCYNELYNFDISFKSVYVNYFRN